MATVQNANRLTGMYSGLDTDGLVKALTMGQQSKIDSLNQKKQQAEWKKDILTDFNNKLRVFKESFGSVLGDKSLLSKGTYTNFAVKMADNTGVSIVASATAKAGSYNVRVDQIATASAMRGAKLTARTTGLTDAEVNSTSIKNLSALTRGGYNSEDIRFTINGKEFEFSTDTTLKNIMDTVNKANVGVTMSYSQTTDSVSIVSTAMGAFGNLADPGDAPVDPGAYNGVRPTPGDPNYEDALAAYQKGYDEYQNTVVAQYKTDYAQWEADTAAYKEDAKKTITVTDSSDFLSHLGLSGVTNGQNAVVYLNGETEARHLDTNSITLDGVTMSFLRVTGETGVDYTLTADHSAAVDKIKQFVEGYNSLIKELYAAYTQKNNRDYKPLTEEQRSALSEKEIENWEAKAKEGLLYRDNTLGKLVDKMRNVLSKTFGDFGNLSSIGITTSKYSVSDAVQLELDETKFLAALESDADRVNNLMSAQPSDDDDGGLMIRLNKMMDDYVSAIKSKDLQNLSNNITDYTKRITEQEDRLSTMSEKYYLQYAKLESSLSQLQSQQDSLSSLFGTSSS